MKLMKVHAALVAAALLATGVGIGYPGWDGGGQAIAASSTQKAQARKDFNQSIKALKALDTAYAAGNTAEAQTQYAKARSNWDKVSPLISAREAREGQLLYDSLDGLLKGGASAKKVHNTVVAMISEGLADVARELK